MQGSSLTDDADGEPSTTISHEESRAVTLTARKGLPLTRYGEGEEIVYSHVKA